MIDIVNIPVEPVITTDLWQRGVVVSSDTSIQEDETIAGILEVIPFLRERENFLIADQMIQRAQEMNAMWGLRHAEALLRNPQYIPQAATGFYIPFVGTILQLRYPAGRRSIPCLNSVHYPARWYLFFADLHDQFFGGGRFLRIQGQTNP